MSKHVVVKTRLSEGEKKAWVGFCQLAGEPESKMLRKMVLKVSGSAGASPPTKKREPNAGKVTVRLADSERCKLLEKVEREGYDNPTKWVTAVVKSALHREPVLTDNEVAALRESNRELAAIGRNLNQVARALNIEFRDSDRLKQETVEKLAERIEQHKDQVAALLSRNMRRWDEDDG
jgi:hypothetical protein